MKVTSNVIRDLSGGILSHLHCIDRHFRTPQHRCSILSRFEASFVRSNLRGGFSSVRRLLCVLERCETSPSKTLHLHSIPTRKSRGRRTGDSSAICCRRSVLLAIRQVVRHPEENAQHQPHFHQWQS